MCEFIFVLEHSAHYIADNEWNHPEDPEVSEDHTRNPPWNCCRAQVPITNRQGSHHRPPQTITIGLIFKVAEEPCWYEYTDDVYDKNEPESVCYEE